MAPPEKTLPIDRGLSLRMQLEAEEDALHILLEHPHRNLMPARSLDALSRFRDELLHSGQLIRERGHPDAGRDRDELLRAFLALLTLHGEIGQCLAAAMFDFLGEDIVCEVPRMPR